MSPLRILSWALPLLLLAAVAVTYLRRDTGARPPVRLPPPATPEDAIGYPREVRLPEGGRVQLLERPRRVLVANASLLDAVVAVFPSERLAGLPVQALTWSSIARHPEPYAAVPRFERFAAEELLALSPDLVICTTLSSGETVLALQAAGVPVLRLPMPEELDGARRDLAFIAELLGVEERAQDFDRQLQQRIETIVNDASERAHLSAAFYVHDGSEGWSSGARTPAEEILRLAGPSNATSAAGHVGAVRLSFEDLLTLDPDVLVVPSAFGEEDGQTEKLLRSEPALASLQAVVKQRIIALHPSLFTTSSIEIVTAAEELATALDALIERGRGRR